ncbi:MAG: MotA/TolQ/ExbB proton channel family protein [Lacipirellulaceae bacterium]
MGLFCLRGSLLAASLLACLALWAPTSARAQDDAAPGAADPAAEADAPAADSPAVPQRLSYLAWMYKALGLTYTIAFLAMSFVLVGVLVLSAVKVTRSAISPPDLVEAFEAHVGAGQYTEAYELAAGDESFLGKVLAAGLGKLSGGSSYPQAVEAMQEVGEDENMKLDHLLSYIAIIGTTAPMVGLLGTVDGMIRSFDVIATSATAPKPSELADGIATALVTTLVGLMLAIPAVAIYNILRNRLARFSLEVGIVSDGLMSRFQKQDATLG